MIRRFLKRYRWAIVVVEAALLLAAIAMTAATRDARAGVMIFAGGNVAVVALLPFVLLLILWTFVALSIPILLHELGHFVAGRLVGFRFISIHVGNLVIAHRRGRLRVIRTGDWTGFHGLCRMYVVGARSVRARFAAFILGGPLATAATLAGLIYCRSLFPPADPEHEALAVGVLRLSTNLMFFGSIALLGLAVVPMRFSRRASDGLALIECLDSRRAKVLALESRVSEWMIQQQRARNWDGRVLAELVSLSSGTRTEAHYRLCLYYHLLDSGRLAEAAEQIEAAVAKVPRKKIIHDEDLLLLIEGAYCRAFVTGDSAGARELFDAANTSVATHLATQRLRAAAAINRLNGHQAEADDAVRQAENLLREASLKDDDSLPENYVAEIEWLQALRSDASVDHDQCDPVGAAT